MEAWATIRHLHAQGHSVRRISRELHLSRQAVCRRTEQPRAASLAIFGIATDVSAALGVTMSGVFIQAVGYGMAFTIVSLLQLGRIAMLVADAVINRGATRPA